MRLRDAIVRLAHEVPEMRRHLIPLLKTAKAISRPLLNDIKLPWQMTLQEWTHPRPRPTRPTKPGYVLVYHRTKDSNYADLLSILRNGLQTKYAHGEGGEPTQRLFATSTYKGAYQGEHLLQLQVEKSRINGSSEVFWYGDVPPEDILWVDLAAPRSSITFSGERYSTYRSADEDSETYYNTYIQEHKAGTPVRFG